MVGVLPGPEPGALRIFFQAAVGLLACIDQRDVPFIGFGLFIQHRKDAGRAGHRHHNAVGLLADLADRLGCVFVQRQKRDQRADGQPAVPAKREHRAHRRAEHIADVAKVAVDRHRDVRKGVGFVGAFAQPVVQRAELLDRLILVAEHLDDLLPVHHLFNVTVHRAKVGLLPGKIPPRPRGDLQRGRHHHPDHYDRNQAQRHIQHKHTDQRRRQRDGRIQQLRHALAEELAQRVHVVGIDRHDVAVGMGIKIADRQRFHVGEQLLTQPAHRALAHVDHNPVIPEGAGHAEGIDHRHPHQRQSQRAEIRAGALGQRGDIDINQLLCEQRSLHRGQRRPHNAEGDRQAGTLVLPEHVPQYTPQRARHPGGAAARGRVLCVCHVKHLPFRPAGQNRRRPGFALHRFRGRSCLFSKGCRGYQTR